MSENFEKIYFKFHPDEINSGIELKISAALSNYKNIEFVAIEEIIEQVIGSYKARFMISYFSSSLKNLFFYGLEPIFISHLIFFLKDIRVIVQYNTYLKTLNYNFVSSFKDINPRYHSDLTVKDTISIIDIVRRGEQI